MEEKVRTFIAVPLPDFVKEALDEAAQKLQLQLPDKSIRWVRPDRMHLTLRFLGDTAVSQIPTVAAQLNQLQFEPIRLQLNNLGCFPNKKRPRVLWVGLQGEVAYLEQLKRKIDQQLEPLGWPLETKKYSPHLTIGRVKKQRQLTNMRWGSEVEQVHFRATAVHLIQSTLQKEGPVYTTLHSVGLG